MALDKIPSYDEFLKHGITPIIPEDIPASSRDRCSACWQEFGEPASDGEVEPLVQFLQCMHIMGRGCFERWLVSSNHNTCPICRATLFDLDPLDEPRINLLPPSDVFPARMGIVRFNPAASAALRARSVASADALASHMRRLLVLYGQGMWPQEYASLHVSHLASCMMDVGDWLSNERRWPLQVRDLEHTLLLVAANRLLRDVSIMPGGSSLADAWATIRNAEGGDNISRTVLVFVDTMLAFAAGFDSIGDETLAVLM
ncbi:hypothetical protein B0A49_00375 [Neofusicoccum parvum]|uniref:Uncharacterized protein n=1 Tax=Neofusicoccum parvum TaxID=310453 RepID=A0ACB5S092_9PEZI|nr:hypothetical protein B0A49_00375 [Neofusicoccum parvum]